MVIAWSVYGIINIAGRNYIPGKPLFAYLKNIYMSVLPIFTFYVFAKKRVLTETIIRRCIYIFIIVSICQFYNGFGQNYEEYKTALENVTTNASYYVVAILPLFPILRKQTVIKYTLLSVCMYYIFLGFKRGAILCGSICFLAIIINDVKMNRINRDHISVRQVLLLFSIIIAMIGLITIMQNRLVSNDYFAKRLELTKEGDSSGRDVLYSVYFNYFITQGNAFNFVFGGGADTTIRQLHKYAHNDWLEIAINNGLWLLLFYFIYWVAFLKLIRKRRWDSISYQMITLFVIIYFLRSIFSMSYNAIPMYSSCAIGYALVNYKAGVRSCVIEENKDLL